MCDHHVWYLSLSSLTAGTTHRLLVNFEPGGSLLSASPLGCLSQLCRPSGAGLMRLVTVAACCSRRLFTRVPSPTEVSCWCFFFRSNPNDCLTLAGKVDDRVQFYHITQLRRSNSLARCLTFFCLLACTRSLGPGGGIALCSEF